MRVQGFFTVNKLYKFYGYNFLENCGMSGKFVLTGMSENFAINATTEYKKNCHISTVVSSEYV